MADAIASLLDDPERAAAMAAAGRAAVKRDGSWQAVVARTLPLLEPGLEPTAEVVPA
jgi:hypothetical protein